MTRTGSIAAAPIRDAQGRTVRVEKRPMGRREEAGSPAPARPNLTARLLELRDRIRRLTVDDRHRPGRFLEEKDEICKELGDLIREARPAGQSGGR